MKISSVWYPQRRKKPAKKKHRAQNIHLFSWNNDKGIISHKQLRGVARLCGRKVHVFWTKSLNMFAKCLLMFTWLFFCCWYFWSSLFFGWRCTAQQSTDAKHFATVLLKWFSRMRIISVLRKYVQLVPHLRAPIPALMHATEYELH